MKLNSNKNWFNIFPFLLIVLSGLWLIEGCNNISSKKDLPNIIIFIADDLGYGDLGCYGCTDIETPNIDNLAKEGIRFTNFYSNGPECTPTRVALMTGRYQQRVGGLECAVGAGNVGRYDEAEWLAGQGELGLPVSENTLLQNLKDKGYQTAMFGKWHLGYEKKFRPLKHGFDYSFGPIGYGGDYFYHTEQVETGMDDLTGMHTLMENNQEVFYTGRYYTRLFTQKAVEWLKSRKTAKPFFLYMPYTAPHSPYQGPDDMIDRPLTADEWNIGTRETYVKMVESLDSGIGNILDYLSENRLEEETLVIFFSDNGGTKKADNGPFSGFKGQVYEGGIHVPCIIKWPEKIEKNKVSNQICMSFDITASILEIIGVENDLELDGTDIISHAQKNKPDINRTLFWRKKRGTNVYKAIRDGDWKYLNQSDGSIVKNEGLFNLNNDSSEKENMLEEKPELAEQLKIKIMEWEREVKAERLKSY